MPHPSSETEIQRLTTVYETYRQSSLADQGSAVHRQWSLKNRGNRAILRERAAAARLALQQANHLPLTHHRILDLGCGAGDVLAGLRQWGAQPANLHGVDLLPDRIDRARQRHPQLNFSVANAEQLHYPDAHFHLILIYTVFSSILAPTMAHNVARQAARVLKPRGAILWYDFRFNNPRNPHVRGVAKNTIQTLFPEFTMRLKTITLLPPLARRLGPFTPILYPTLARLPPLRTHHLGLLTRF